MKSFFLCAALCLFALPAIAQQPCPNGRCGVPQADASFRLRIGIVPWRIDMQRTLPNGQREVRRRGFVPWRLDVTRGR